MQCLKLETIAAIKARLLQQGDSDRRAELCGLDDASLLLLIRHQRPGCEILDTVVKDKAREILADREKGRQIERDLQKSAAIKAQIADLLERAEGVKLGIMDARASQPPKDAAWLELACYKALYEQAAALLVAAAGRI